MEMQLKKKKKNHYSSSRYKQAAGLSKSPKIFS